MVCYLPRRRCEDTRGCLKADFDEFYVSVAEGVSFDKCELGCILESEGPQEITSFAEWESKEL